MEKKRKSFLLCKLYKEVNETEKPKTKEFSSRSNIKKALLHGALVCSTKPCHDFTGSAAATSLCCLTLGTPANSEAETEISYMVPQPPCRYFLF